MSYALKNKIIAGVAALFSAAIFVSASIAPAVNNTALVI